MIRCTSYTYVFSHGSFEEPHQRQIVVRYQKLVALVTQMRRTGVATHADEVFEFIWITSGVSISHIEEVPSSIWSCIVYMHESFARASWPGPRMKGCTM